MGDALVGEQTLCLLEHAVRLAVQALGLGGGLLRGFAGAAQRRFGVGGLGAGAVEAVDDGPLLVRGAAQRRRTVEHLRGIAGAAERGRQRVALAHGGAGHLVEGALGAAQFVAGVAEGALGLVDGAAGALGLAAGLFEVHVGAVGVLAQAAHVQLEFGDPAFLGGDLGHQRLQKIVGRGLGVRVAAGRLSRHGGRMRDHQADYHGSGNGAGPP